MKAAVLFAFVAGAAATNVCAIPSQYATAGTTCTGAGLGYQVWGACLSGVSPTAVAGAINTRVAIGEALTAFDVDGTNAVAPTGSHCIVPIPVGDWKVTSPGADVVQTAAGLNDDCGAMGGTTVGLDGLVDNDWVATVGNYKGVEIQCAENYYPAQGFEGTNICQTNTGLFYTAGGTNVVFPAADAAVTAPYWTAGDLQALDESITDSATAHAEAHITDFEGNNALQCAPACPLPETVCANGAWFPNVAHSNVQHGDSSACTIKPNHKYLQTTTGGNIAQNTADFFCKSTKGMSTHYSYTCNAVDAPAVTATDATAVGTAYTGECGTMYGASTEFLIDGHHDDFPVGTATITQAVQEIVNFPAVDSILSVATTNVLGGQAHRYWNNNPVQKFQPATSYKIDVAHCEDQTTTDLQQQCVQQTVNWWHCKYDFPVDHSVCYAGADVIPCPTHELGFRCPSSSKKGLLGLLGLIAIPLLCLLLCCPLLLCCLRRKKTESDVHFATFDPLGAPATACAVPTAMGCPTAFGATPFAQSAVPML